MSSPPATPHDLALLYARRVVTLKAYREVKQHPGWAQYQVRSDIAMRRHWALVCAAFCLLWWYAAQHDQQAPPQEQHGHEARPSWSGPLREVRGWLEPFVLLWRVVRAVGLRRPQGVVRRALERCSVGIPLCTYIT